jgi:mRNA interferase MazF
MMQRGEVWQTDIPYTPGHAQAGVRPAVILQDTPFLASLPTVLIVPFTGTLSTARFSGTLFVQPDGRNGLAIPSVALVFQLRALDRHFCRHRLGVLDAATLDRIFAELDKLTGR